MIKILLVEDDEQVSAVIRQILEMEGYEVHSCGNGNEALNFLRKKEIIPDLIVTDIIMPDKEGLEFIREIRQIDKDKKIIAISGGSPHMLAHEPLKVAKLFGANLTFPKPLDRTEFLKGIKQLLEE